MNSNLKKNYTPGKAKRRPDGGEPSPVKKIGNLATANKPKKKG